MRRSHKLQKKTLKPPILGRGV